MLGNAKRSFSLFVCSLKSNTLTNRLFFSFSLFFSLQCDSEGDDDKVRGSNDSSQTLRETHSKQPFVNLIVISIVNDWNLICVHLNDINLNLQNSHSEFMQIKYKFQQLKRILQQPFFFHAEKRREIKNAKPFECIVFLLQNKKFV